MQVAPSCGQFFNSCKWCHLVAKFGTNASGAIWWPIFQLMQLMQVAPSCGQFFNSCKWRHLVAKFGTNASGATISWRDNSSLDAIPWVRCASGNVCIEWPTPAVFKFIPPVRNVFAPQRILSFSCFYTLPLFKRNRRNNKIPWKSHNFKKFCFFLFLEFDILALAKVPAFQK